MGIIINHTYVKKCRYYL